MGCNQGVNSQRRVGPIVYRVMTFAEVGDSIPPHTHHFPHATIGVRGRVRVNLYYLGVLAESVVLGPREGINVPADAEHEIVGEEPDSEGWCIFVNHGTSEDAL